MRTELGMVCVSHQQTENPMRYQPAPPVLFLAMLLALTLVGGVASAQQQLFRGEVDYPYLGIRLTIPSGWAGAVSGDYLLIGSETEPGLIALTTHEATGVSQLKAVADQGLTDDNVVLRRSGKFEQVGAEGLAAEFSGSLQGQPAKAFVAGIINPHGPGVSILAVTSADKYGKRQPELVRDIVRHLKFSRPKESPFNAQWQQALTGKKLTYMKSSYSADPGYTDASGTSWSAYSSYSRRTVIHLCPGNVFQRYSSASSSFDTQGGFGGTNSRGDSAGNWRLVTGSAGESILQLNAQNGETLEYELDYRNSKTYLNNTRYFRTPSGAC